MATSESTGLPADWEVKHSRTKGLPYYFNSKTTESRWEPPTDTDTELLKKYMAEFHSTSSVPEDTASGDSSSPEKIQCWHLLVKHIESRRPSSWREKEITRSKEEARQRLTEFKARIDAGESLSDLAREESDCSSARKGGDLGRFGRDEMQKEFEDAAFALEPGAVSDIVDTASGLHLIQRGVES